MKNSSGTSLHAPEDQIDNSNSISHIKQVNGKTVKLKREGSLTSEYSSSTEMETPKQLKRFGGITR